MEEVETTVDLVEATLDSAEITAAVSLVASLAVANLAAVAAVSLAVAANLVAARVKNVAAAVVESESTIKNKRVLL